jgi:hypothetical protein
VKKRLLQQEIKESGGMDGLSLYEHAYRDKDRLAI